MVQIDKWLEATENSNNFTMLGRPASGMTSFFSNYDDKVFSNAPGNMYVYTVDNDLDAIVAESQFTFAGGNQEPVHHESWLVTKDCDDDLDYFTDAEDVKFGLVILFDNANVDVDTEWLKSWAEDNYYAADDSGFILDIITTFGGNYKSLMCKGEGCCPEEGYPIHPDDKEETEEVISLADMQKFIAEALTKLNNNNDDESESEVK